MISLLKEYGGQRLELLKLEATEKGVLTAGTVVSLALIIIPFFVFMALLNIAVAFLLGYYFNNFAYGFFAVAGFYFLLFLIFLLAQKGIKNAVANLILKLIS